jgi:hypothetical protein
MPSSSPSTKRGWRPLQRLSMGPRRTLLSWHGLTYLFAEANGQSKIVHCEYPVMRVHNLSHKNVASKSIRARPLEPPVTFSCCEEPVSGLWLFLGSYRPSPVTLLHRCDIRAASENSALIAFEIVQCGGSPSRS